LRKLDRTNVVIGLGVWLVVLAVYYITKAPTLSLWDCGEFIAASAVLGIPHPPGTPLYIILGRIFYVLPIAADVAVRVNLLSVLSSSFAVLFAYLSAVKLLRSWFADSRGVLSRVLTYGGAVSGALFVAWSRTHWNNSVEAEVYGLAMMLMMAMIWLTLCYREAEGTPRAQQYMLTVFFIAFLGIGVHMTVFLVVPVLGLFFVLKKEAPSWVWFAIGAYFVIELYLILAMSSPPGEIPYYVPLVIVGVLYLFYMFSFEKISGVSYLIALGFVLSVLPVFGESVNAFSHSSVFGTATIDAMAVVGRVALVLTAAYALYLLLVRRRSLSNNPKALQHVLVPAGFVIAAVLLEGVLYLVKGYEAFLFLSAVLAGVLAFAVRRYLHWPILVAFGGVSLIIIGLAPFLWGMVAAVLVNLFLGLVFRVPGWRAGLLIVLVAILGFSIHAYLPIRSAQDPMINENNPSRSLQATIDFIERKQYGSVSMTERMFTRRGEWANQFGDYQRMGFWRFFHEQFGMSGPRFAFPLLLGVFGLWEMARRRHRQGIAYILLLLLATVGLVLYMNFSDGTKIGQLDGIDYLEVRDRDYFFTPGFMLFGLTIGLGLAVALQYLRESVAHFSSGPRRVIMGASVVVFLLPVFALANNYYYADRSGNYIAYDYAHNLLSSAEENSVLFTLGDNDTFPLWCLQEAYGVRKDVAVVNLSLANTKWYIRQVRDYMNVPLGWSDDDIENLRAFRTRDGKDFHLRSQLVDIILARALSVRPVGFSVTVTSDYRRYFGERIDSLLVLHGMTWRVQRQAAGAVTVNADYCYDYFTDPEMFRARSFNDPSVYKDETSLRLTGNYGNGILLTADSLRKAGDFERATHLLEHSVEHLPFISRLVRYLASLYMEQGELEKLQTLVETDESAEFDQMHYMLGRTYQQRGMLAEAEEQFRLVLDTSPDYRPAFDELLRICYEAGEFGALRTILTDWIRHNPGDELAPQMLMEVEQELGRQADSVGKDDADSGAELE
jgi:tetratricopeptide (TPR) repeat protein